MINFKKYYSIGVDYDDKNIRIAVIEQSSLGKTLVMSREIRPIAGAIEGNRIKTAAKLAWQLESELGQFYPKWRTVRHLVFSWPENLTYYHFSTIDLSSAKESLPEKIIGSLPLDPSFSIYAYYNFDHQGRTISVCAAADRSEIGCWQAMVKKLGRADAILDLSSQAFYRSLTGRFGRSSLVLDINSQPAVIYNFSEQGLLAVNWIGNSGNKAINSEHYREVVSELKKTISMSEDKYLVKPEKIILVGRLADMSELEKLIEADNIIKVETAGDIFKEAKPEFLRTIGTAKRAAPKSYFHKNTSIEVNWAETPKIKGQVENLAKLTRKFSSNFIEIKSKLILAVMLVIFTFLAGLTFNITSNYYRVKTDKKNNFNEQGEVTKTPIEAEPEIERGSVRTQVIFATIGGQSQALKSRLVKVRIAKAVDLADSLKQGKIMAEKYLNKGESLFELPLQHYATSTPLKYPLSLSWLAYQKNEYDLTVKTRVQLAAGKENIEIESIKTLGIDTVGRNVYEAWLEAGYQVTDTKATSTK